MPRSLQNTTARARVLSISCRLPIIARLLLAFYVKFVSRQFVSDRSMPVILFSDCDAASSLSFNRISVVNNEWQFLAQFQCLRTLILITTPEGLDHFRKVRKLFGDNYVIFSHLPQKKDGTDIFPPKIGSFPVPAYSSSLTYNNDVFTPAHLLAFLLTIWAIGFQLKSFYPKDDLLRHAVAYLWHYDYAIPYTATTYSPGFDFYIGFDVVMGFFHRALGSYSLVIPQYIALTLTFLATNRLLRGAANNVRVILLMFTVQYVAGRIMLGRPSVVCSSIMLILYAYDEDLPLTVRMTAALLMSSLYYLFPIYMVPLIIRDRKYLLPLGGGILFWLYYSGGNYFSEALAVVFSLSEQNMAVSENKTILSFYFKMFIFTLPMLRYWRQDVRTALSAFYLSLSNQVRYVETLLSLIISFFRYVPVKLTLTPTMTLGVIFMLLAQMPWGTQHLLTDIPGRIPNRADVLTEDMNVMYQLIYDNPSLHVSPCYAYGWTAPRVQKTIKDIAQGKLDCRDLKDEPFDYIVEGSLTGPPPHCLELLSVEHGKRLWAVSHPRTKSNIEYR